MVIQGYAARDARVAVGKVTAAKGIAIVMQNGFGIAGVGTYVPLDSLQCDALAKDLGVPSQTLQSRIGFSTLVRKASDENAPDIACRAVNALIESYKISHESLDCIAVVTQNPDGYGIPQVSAIIHGQFGLEGHVGLSWASTVLHRCNVHRRASAYDLNSSKEVCA